MTLDDVLAARVRELVDEELRRRGLAGGPPREERLLYTVPEAARLTSISVDTLRKWIEEGRLTRRVKNPDAVRPIFLVSLDEIRAASEGQRPAPAPSPVNLAAARIARGGRARG